ncbi:uncharacterized protein C8Q71DRAFT_486314 [Rhodofomes roseus]|uniref:TRIP4/RQT4 C2HC5-type zinc finger domain-containing protein n=1 Tax=Rhodofomes roseus TaxID=34475 RepID=A0ABQ8KQW4_9APHY|nr:uncharacterized protein C8Q71DRAFT_486314 [Rhodofomes roseus]KAH9840321.1 hypothetical protein C8Q71DRAFT_486314 [Rhodofomes roseus]
MHHTAWTSDRIQPSKPKGSGQPQGKGKQKAQEAAKSKEVRRLEQLRDGLRHTTGRERDPKGGCFCQARMHVLSPYTPVCRSCGLILCELQVPRYACPHCASPLLTPDVRTVLEARLETQIAETLAREEEDRQHAIEQARAAAGAFPTLAVGASGLPSSASDILSSHPANQTHRVLSLNSKTKKVTVSSYHSSPAISRSASRESGLKDEVQPESKRVPPPPSEVPHAQGSVDPHRPWANMRDGNVTYMPPPQVNAGGSSSQQGRKRKGRKSGKEKENET